LPGSEAWPNVQPCRFTPVWAGSATTMGETRPRFRGRFQVGLENQAQVGIQFPDKSRPTAGFGYKSKTLSRQIPANGWFRVQVEDPFQTNPGQRLVSGTSRSRLSTLRAVSSVFGYSFQSTFTTNPGFKRFRVQAEDHFQY
jgi:hypothetical protein